MRDRCYICGKGLNCSDDIVKTNFGYFNGGLVHRKCFLETYGDIMAEFE